MSAHYGPIKTKYADPPPPLTVDDVRKWPAGFCSACGRIFARSAAYKTMCVPCFKAGNGSPRTPADDAHLWLQLTAHQMLGELQRLTVEIDDLRAELADVEPPMDDGLLKDLIFFAHPDRNKGSARATATTRALNAIRDRRAK